MPIAYDLELIYFRSLPIRLKNITGLVLTSTVYILTLLLIGRHKRNGGKLCLG